MGEKERLIKSLDLNMIESGVFWGKSTGSRVVELDPIVCISTEVPIPELNMVYSTRPSRSKIKTLVKDTISYFNAMKKPFFWWVVQSNFTEELKNLFDENNMKLRTTSSAMSLDLNNDIESKSTGDDFIIRKVCSKQELDDFADASYLGFEVKEENECLFKNFIVKMRYDSPRQELYTGYYKNKPICTGLIYIEGGVAGLYWISTIPDYRKKGFGLSLTSHILEQIKKRGIKTAVLNSSKAGSNLYRKLGFEELAKVYLYSLEN